AHIATLVDQVVTDPDALDATSHDTWPMTTKWAAVGRHPHRAEAVARVSLPGQVSALLAAASAAGVPVTTRALASSVTGQPIPTQGGVVLDIMGLEPKLEVNETDLVVTASANYLGSAVENHLNQLGYTLGHSPQSLLRSTVGGWLATLATGQFSSLYGGIEDLVVAYDVILATGEQIRLEAKPRAAMGPDLRQLFIGSEGTLGVITEVTLKIFPIAPVEILQTYSLPSVRSGLEFMRAQAAAGLRPFLLRLYDADEARHAMVDPAFASCCLFLGSRGLEGVAEAEFAALDRLVVASGGQPLGPDGAAAWMDRRYDFSSVEDKVATPGGIAETIEVAHYWSGVEGLYDDLKATLAPLADEVLSHFSHVYTQGTSLYMILFAQVADDEAAIARLEDIWSATMATCLAHGAELSHHHGGGLVRSPYSRRSLGSAHLVLDKVKQALDPAGILNPGKLGL
ncbi:MAG: FAD-binding oxidoreductase, partial [Propionibacteriaceae bacterium]|nr:FAD-binding oxidoreductase [Propionibacteriaceae bacterium]